MEQMSIQEPERPKRAAAAPAPVLEEELLDGRGVLEVILLCKKWNDHSGKVSGADYALR